MSVTELLILAIVGHGAVNALATSVFTQNMIFKDVRRFIKRQGCKLKRNWPRLGEKIVYFPTCPMCVGVWIGFAQATVFTGPIPTNYWVSIIVNGLLFKFWGHLWFQLLAFMHQKIENIKPATEHTAHLVTQQDICDRIMAA